MSKDARVPQKPASLTETVHNSKGEFGDRLVEAKRALKERARKEGLVVVRFDQTPAKVVGWEDTDDGEAEDGSPIVRKVQVCEITVTAHVGPAGPERWVRLTSSSGPAAVEVLETEAGRIVRRYEKHPEDVRHIALGFAETALTEMAGSALDDKS